MKKKLLIFLICLMLGTTFVIFLPSEEAVIPDTYSCWYFDEGFGTIAYDSVGNNDGTLYGNTNWIIGHTGAYPDYALHFDGDMDYVSFGNDPSLDGSSQTIALWVRYTDTPSACAMLLNDYTGSYGDWGMALLVQNDGRIRVHVASGTGSMWAPSTNPLNDGEWHFVAATYVGSVVTLYIDGDFDIMNNWGRNLAHRSYVGWYAGIDAGYVDDMPVNTNCYTGDVDEVYIFTTALSEYEIQVLMGSYFNVPPVVDFTYDPLNPLKSDIVQFTDTSTDSDGTVDAWWWDFDDGYFSNLQNPIHCYYTNGAYDVELTVSDNDGSYNITEKTIYVGPVNQPPYQPNTPIPDDGAVDRPITQQLSWSGDDPDGDLVTYDVYFRTSNPPPNVANDQLATSYDPGTLNYDTTYYWQIVSDDNNGSTVDGPIWSFATRSVPQTPTADFSFTPINPTTGKIVQFTDASTDPDGTIVNWSWDFGDREVSYEQNPQHQYMIAGDYSVELTVKDNDDKTDSIGKDIAVIEGTEQLDQQQTKTGYNFAIFSSRWGAQSFKPTLGVLTKLELFIGKQGSFSSDIIVSIRSDPSGSDLSVVIKSASEIPSAYSWIEFDIPDLAVNPDETYYIIVRNDGGGATKYYKWNFGYNTPYIRGNFLFTSNSGSTWKGYSQYDCCFKTYGM